jgi:hypothetical protein
MKAQTLTIDLELMEIAPSNPKTLAGFLLTYASAASHYFEETFPTKEEVGTRAQEIASKGFKEVQIFVANGSRWDLVFQF